MGSLGEKEEGGGGRVEILWQTQCLHRATLLVIYGGVFGGG